MDALLVLDGKIIVRGSSKPPDTSGSFETQVGACSPGRLSCATSPPEHCRRYLGAGASLFFSPSFSSFFSRASLFRGIPEKTKRKSKNFFLLLRNAGLGVDVAIERESLRFPRCMSVAVRVRRMRATWRSAREVAPRSAAHRESEKRCAQPAGAFRRFASGWPRGGLGVVIA